MTVLQKTLHFSEKSPLVKEEIAIKINGNDIVNDCQKNISSDVKNITDRVVMATDDAKYEKSRFKLIAILSDRRKCAMIFIVSASLLAGVSSSLLGPFFPLEATKKGMNNILIGFVFGLFGMATFTTAPFFGSHLTKLGPKFTFISGVFVGGCCNILFGTIAFCPSGTPFIVITILIRFTEAIGFSAYLTSSFAIVSSEFSENIGFSLGVLETANGLGLALGPIIGGALHELGGFSLPYYVVGILVLLNGLLAYNYIPSIKEIPEKREGSVLTLFRSPLVIISIGTLFFGKMGVSTYHSTLAKHMAPLNLSVGLIGMVFGVVSFLYSISSFLCGYISDTLDIQAPLIISGGLLLGIGFMIMGPSILLPFIPFTLTTTCIGLAFYGVSLGCLFIPTMKYMVTGAVQLGFENNIDTYALVSGLFHAAYTLGGFIGPLGIGVLIQECGYSLSYTVIGMMNISWVIVCILFFTFRRLTLTLTRRST